MKIGLNCVFLVPGETGGMEVYARELVAALAGRDDVELVAFVSRAAAGVFAGDVREEVLPVDARRRVDWVRGEQLELPRRAARAGVELVHSLASTAPARGPFRRLVTVHDLIYRVLPEAHFGMRALGMRVLVPLAARRSDRIIVDAASTRDDLVRYLGTDPAKVDVVPLGVGQTQAVKPTAGAEIRARLGLGERPFVLSVSAKRAHKNLARLIEAIALLEPDGRPMLVLPGYATPYEAELRAIARDRGLEADVIFPEWVSQADLEGLYAEAELFAFPSLYEGFGLPVLEAMTRGVPVVTSGRASLAEVAGDAALLVDPEDPRAIADAVARVVADPALRERMRSDGRAQATRFTWERTAELTLESYRRVLGPAGESPSR
ncbi:MAG TPA: glycosyltransferase family 1 protein [Solirubrobacteraceae bacterium]|nr:glycosyltransferase family 1 protein [Solirubrobacteraceae bacterium]